MHLWGIFFALPAKNGLSPAELKFRENTSVMGHYLRWWTGFKLTSATSLQHSNQLSEQANWELVIKLIRNITGKDEDETMNIQSTPT